MCTLKSNKNKALNLDGNKVNIILQKKMEASIKNVYAILDNNELIR